MILSNHFFEDEIREGFYVPSSVKQAWGAQLKVLSYIDEVCKKHDIHYYVDWGTFLGAVRHGGYIPWDDDMDIGMLRDDYERFLKVSNELPDGFCVYNLRSKEDHTQFLSNVVNKSRICFEPEHLREYHGFPYIACVDIFIIDYLSNDPVKNAEMFSKAKMVLGLSDSIRDGSFDTKKLDIALKKIEEKCDVNIPRGMSTQKLVNYLDVLAEKIFGAFSKEDSKEVVQMMPWGLKGVKAQKREWYDSFIEIPFEEIKVPVPNRYIDALTARYGDFMKIYKDAGAHDYPYFLGQKKNLQKVLDFELPEYKFDPEELRKNSESQKANISRSVDCYKSIVEECLGELDSLWKEFATNNDMAFLNDIQSLAIELGTYMESVKGEGYDVVHILEELCEKVYECAQGTASSDEVKENLTLLKEVVSRRKEVVFLPFKADYFNRFEPEYERLKNDPDTDVFVVPIPYYYKDYDGSLINQQYDLDSYKSSLNVIHCDCFNFEIHQPDVIYIQYPYDGINEVTGIPPFLYASNLKNYTDELVYIPWFVTEDFTKESARNFKNMRYYVTVPGVVNADKVYVQSETIRETYIEALCQWAGEKTRSVWENKIYIEKVTRVSKKKEYPEKWKKYLFKKDGSLKKIVLYHVETASLVSDKGILDKIDRNLKIFEASKEDVMLIWKEHSETATQLPKIDLNMYKEFTELVHYFITMDFGIYLTDISDSELSSIDAYYGDPGVLAHKFRNMNKPVMIQNVEI